MSKASGGNGNAGRTSGAAGRAAAALTPSARVKQVINEVAFYRAGMLSAPAMAKTIEGLRAKDARDVAARLGVRVQDGVSAKGVRAAIKKDLGV